MNAPEMRTVGSSTIAAIGYDPGARELYVQFHSPPGTYVYYPVDAAVFEEFLRASSKGDYFNRKVKGTSDEARPRGRAPGDTPFERAIAHPVSGAQYIPGVAVGVSVVANAAVAVEAVGGGDRWRFTVEEQSGAGEEGAVEEVAAGDRLVEAEAIVADHSSLSARCLMVVRK